MINHDIQLIQVSILINNPKWIKLTKELLAALVRKGSDAAPAPPGHQEMSRNEGQHEKLYDTVDGNQKSGYCNHLRCMKPCK